VYLYIHTNILFYMAPPIAFLTLTKRLLFWWASSLAVGLAWFNLLFPPTVMASPSYVPLAVINCGLLPAVVGLVAKPSAKEAFLFVLIFIILSGTVVACVITPAVWRSVSSQERSAINLLHSFYSNPTSSLDYVMCFRYHLQRLRSPHSAAFSVCDSVPVAVAISAITAFLLCLVFMWLGARVRQARLFQCAWLTR